MSDDKTLGEVLRGERDRRGESLEQVHERTGIGVRVLASLEQGTGDVVEPVYLRLALTSYCEYLGLPAEDLVARFDRDHGPPPTPEVRESPAPVPLAWHHELADRLRRVPPFWIGAGLAVALLATILLIVHLRNSDGPVRASSRTVAPPRAAPPPEPGRIAASRPTPDGDGDVPPPSTVPARRAPRAAAAAEDQAPAPVSMEATASNLPSPDTTADAVQAGRAGPATASPAGAPEAAASATAPGDVPPPPGASAAVAAPADTPASRVERYGDLEALARGDAVVLEGEAVDSTWVQVQWDGRGVYEEIIPRGERRLWAARDSVLVRAGRAHGIRFHYRGQLLGEGRLGDPTKVLRLRAGRGRVDLLGPDLEPLSRVYPVPDPAATESDVAGP